MVSVVECSPVVDDYISGEFKAEHGEEELCQRREKLQRLSEVDGFPLRKWFCNDLEVCRQINPEATMETRKVLGVIWSPEDDIIKVDLRVGDGESVRAKRVLLSTVAAVYDPLGLSGSVLIKGKHLLRQLCVQGINWDDAVSQKHEKTFLILKEELQTQRFLVVSQIELLGL